MIDIRCQNNKCKKLLVGKQRMWCSKECSNRYHAFWRVHKHNKEFRRCLEIEHTMTRFVDLLYPQLDEDTLVSISVEAVIDVSNYLREEVAERVGKKRMHEWLGDTNE
jgi:hypothetical protein